MSKKIAVFVLGPENSGTKMITECFVRLGFFGDYTHGQRMDDLNFDDKPDHIVFRRSVLHDYLYPNIMKIVRQMRQSGYNVIPIMTMRDKDIMVKSQLRNMTEEDCTRAQAKIYTVYPFIFGNLAKVNLYPIVVDFTSFVKFDYVRQQFFSMFGLSVPDMEFREEDNKYIRGASSEVSDKG